MFFYPLNFYLKVYILNFLREKCVDNRCFCYIIKEGFYVMNIIAFAARQIVLDNCIVTEKLYKKT